jgi:hypothetical protein
MDTLTVAHELRTLAASEIRAISEIASLCLRTRDAQLVRGFLDMLVDEARHARSLLSAAEDITCAPEEPLLDDGTNGTPDATSLAKFLAGIAHVEAELPGLTDQLLDAIPDTPKRDTIRARLRYIPRDEARHHAWANAELRRLLAGHDPADVLAMVDRTPISTDWHYEGCG